MNDFYWKPHPKDPIFDRVVVYSSKPVAGIDRIELRVVERYKTSGLSGDEWRFSWSLRSTGPGLEEPIETSCGFFEAVGLALIPRVLEGSLHERGWAGYFDSNDGDGVLEVYRKGVLCLGRRFDNLIAAAMNAPWWASVYGEQEDFDSATARTIYTGYCAQPGCEAKGDVVYQIKQEYDRSWGRALPEISLGPARRRFCLAHAKRGDCALEDADDNYLVVEAPEGFDPERVRVDASKVTKSRTTIL